MNKNYYTRLTDEEFERSREFGMFFRGNEKLTQDGFGRMKDVRDKVSILISEQNEEWRRDRRAEFLNWKLPKILKEMETKKLYLSYGVHVLGGWQQLKTFADDIVDQLENKYTKYYKELAYLNRGDKKLDGDITEELKNRCRDVPIEDHIDTPFTNMGNGRKSTTCPVHQETEPSFVIYPDNSFHCFGCGLHGNNSIDFMTNAKNYTFMEAIKYLSNQ